MEKEPRVESWNPRVEKELKDREEEVAEKRMSSGVMEEFRKGG